MKVKKMTLLAIYTTIALTIFIVESFIPTPALIPGLKLGLANVVTLWLLIYASFRDALTVLIVRILLASMFAGQFVSFFYSLAGGLLCLLAMGLVHLLLKRKMIVFTSIIGAIFHNIGQVLIALLLLQSLSILAYLPLLLLSAVITGTFTGLCAYFAAKHLPKNIVWPL